MREIHVSEVTASLCRLSLEANVFLGQDIKDALQRAYENECAPVGKEILGQLLENAEEAAASQVPICQDTGMAVVFMEIGQDVHLCGGDLETAIHEGIRLGYEKGFLRKSIVSDPIIRDNTKDNTPAVIHYKIVPGTQVKITLAPKGFGSENMSRVYMLSPSQGIDAAKDRILETVQEAGPNPCPPMVIGVGIGGDFEKCALMAKEALLRPIGQFSSLPHIRQLEIELLEKINRLGIGPQGLGGKTTALALHIETYPTHIAGFPVAINIGCHVTRHRECIL